MKLEYKIAFILFLISIFTPAKYSIAITNWNEDFSVDSTMELTDWEFFGYYKNDLNSPWLPRPHQLVIKDQVLTGPNSQEFDSYDVALHNSSVAYGSWEFDWQTKSVQTNLSLDEIGIIWNDVSGDNYNISGKNFEDFEITGYGLLIGTSDSGLMAPWNYGGIYFAKFLPEYSPAIHVANYSFTAFPPEHNHIKITRDLTGLFTVYFNDESVIAITDNKTTTSTKFYYGSDMGDSGIDNISITDKIPPNHSIPNYQMLMTIATLIIFSRLLKSKTSLK